MKTITPKPSLQEIFRVYRAGCISFWRALALVWCSCVICLAVVGCGFAMKSIQPKHPYYGKAQRSEPTINIDSEISATDDAHHFFHPQKEFDRMAETAMKQAIQILPEMPRSFPGDTNECGACLTNSTLVNPAMAEPITIEFDTSEPVNVIGIDQSTNLTTWQTVYLDRPHLWIGLGHKQVKLTNSEPYAYFRVFVRNER